MRKVAMVAHDFDAMSPVCQLFNGQGCFCCLVPLNDWHLHTRTLQGVFAVVVDEADLRCDTSDDYVMDLEEYLLPPLHGRRILVLEKDGAHHVDIQVRGRTEFWTHQFSEPLQEDFVYRFCNESIRQYAEATS